MSLEASTESSANLDTTCLLDVGILNWNAKTTQGEGGYGVSRQNLPGNLIVLENQWGRWTLVKTNCPGVLMAGLPLATDQYKKGHEDEVGLEHH